MMRWIFTYIVIFFTVQSACAQSGFIKKAQKRLEKTEYNDVEKFIAKSLEKDSLYPAAFYMRSELLFTPDYPEFQIDSAYFNILLAKALYDSLDAKEKDKHAKLGVDLLSIDSLKRRIDVYAFERAIEGDQENDYIFFLKNFPTASQVEMAIGLRNEKAFDNAVKINTYQSYKTFMEKYPQASQWKDAERKYEKLYFDKSTADNKLKSYEQFLRSHPTTPYRKEAEQRIYEVLTADHSVSGYLKFIQKYPQSHLKQQAIDFMFHSAIGSDMINAIPSRYFTDSLKNVQYNSASFLIPFLKNRKFGFIDEKGNIVHDADYIRIGEDQICGGITNDFYVADSKLIGRNGGLIYSESFDEVDDLGYGILKVTQGDNVSFIHKTGRPLLNDKYQDGKLVKGKFLAVKKEGLWGLFSISGVPITKSNFNNIHIEGRFILFEKNHQYDVVKDSQLAGVTDANTLNFKLIFDDYELVNDSTLWLESSYGEVIYDADLNEVIPYAEHEISFLKNRYAAIKEDRLQIYDSLFRPVKPLEFDKFMNNDRWIIYKKDGIWKLLDMKNLTVKDQHYDSMTLLGDYFALGYLNEEIEITTPDQKIIKDQSEGQFSLINAPNSDQYLLFTPGDTRREPSVYNTSGRKIFQSKIDNITTINSHGLLLTQKGKKGMISTSGEYLLRPKYDAIAGQEDGHISILSNKKFGLYDPENDVLIPARYERNLKKYNEQYYIAESDGRKIIIDHNNNQLSKDSFEEVIFWNDTAAIVKNDFLWRLYDLKSGELREPQIKSIRFIRETKEELVAVILVNNSYGVWSNVRGEIIAPTFNDIINVGTVDNHIYFTEKHIEEAEFYVVIYYDEKGELIFKTAIEATDYPMIYCDN